MQTELNLGRQRRDEGLQKVEDNGQRWVDAVRLWAIWHANSFDVVTINDVRRKFKLPLGLHPNTWSAVLKCKELVPIGYCQAEHPAAHARVVRVYRVRK